MGSIEMSEEKLLQSLRDSLVNLDFEGVKKAAEDAMNAGVDPVRAVTDGLAAGLAIVGDMFEKKEYFLSELVVSAEVMKEGMSIIQPYIKGEASKAKGKVVLATVQGDNHDIGKSLVATLLRVSGFDVVDLGVDVPTSRIVEVVKEQKPQILGLSALLTVTMPEMGEIIKELDASGLRGNIKVIVGGSPVTKEFAERIGADYRAEDAVDGVNKCVEWIGSKAR
jgi:5-methyltetrahydrofolate--homocysteine methyltransferase